MKRKFPLSRKTRALLYSIGVLILVVAFYIVLGCPTLTMMQEFRRAEKAHLVGPSTIVDTMDDSEYHDFNKMIVGETEYGITFFGWSYKTRPNSNPFEERSYVFSYQEKTEDVTVAVAPNFWGSIWGGNSYDTLPVYIFAEHPDAVRADLSLTVKGTHTVTEEGVRTETEYTETFAEKASLVEPGIFRCNLTATTETRANAMYHLSCIVSKSGYMSADAAISATVQLYDRSDNLILTKTLDLSSQ